MRHRAKSSRWVRRMGRRTTQKIPIGQTKRWAKSPHFFLFCDLRHRKRLSSASKKYLYTIYLGHQAILTDETRAKGKDFAHTKKLPNETQFA